MIRRTDIYQDLAAVRAAVEAVHPLFDEDGVISVTARPGADRPLKDHVGWLPDGVRERDFTLVNPEFRGTAIEELLGKLPFDFGRTRIMRMAKKSCLSIHWDTSLRYHYAVVTNPACYLIHVEGGVGRFYHIPADGWLYEMDARMTHTAINASREARIHLVICDARDEGLKDGRPEEYAGLRASR
ncbi:MAG: aspartyl/asparaginyl beta-hydroxylase domain-containing protein [Kiloniellaceae bacterium]